MVHIKRANNEGSDLYYDVNMIQFSNIHNDKIKSFGCNVLRQPEY